MKNVRDEISVWAQEITKNAKSDAKKRSPVIDSVFEEEARRKRKLNDKFKKNKRKRV